ncbi:hypothetical protein CROQUDRAFT_102415 [Cronartium quercuum f. sp. fusiforme G11]|uniref:Uncharacterized protein n=1 Tax=Cronartium quercuum f. sp. fusiforme G11 TaxID=708437 RepID=A0A9P6N5L2_9BASI|nr:hypothetical protein CROQUDRAFT_102415 [Cronartium quercuum f. sp. fusiforme G11]
MSNPFAKSTKIPRDSGDSIDASSPTPSTFSSDHPIPTVSDTDSESSLSTAQIIQSTLQPSLFDYEMSNDMAQGITTSKLTILKKGSFICWKRHLLNHLTARELEQYVLEIIPMPSESNLEEKRKYCRERARVMEILENSIDSENQQWIGNASDPKVAYDNLCAQHGSSNGILTTSIISQITTARLQPGQSLSDFLNHIQGLHNTYFDYVMDDPEMKISSKILAIFLLNSLPDRYESITQHFLSNLSLLKCTDVFTRLRMEASCSIGTESVMAFIS